MNRLMCFLTGGHKYSDANIRTETAPDDFNIVILKNHCVKCGALWVTYMDVKKQIEKDIARMKGVIPMPDKLTDNEIKKALEYCSQQGITSECEKCKIKRGCRSELIKLALDLINRLQAEIERLKGIKTNDWLVKGISKEQLEKEKIEALIDNAKKCAKAEAYKECIEKVKKELSLIRLGCRNLLDNDGVFAIDMARKRVDNLLKELVGDGSGN